MITIKQIKAKLYGLGIPYPQDAKKAELMELLEGGLDAINEPLPVEKGFIDPNWDTK